MSEGSGSVEEYVADKTLEKSGVEEDIKEMVKKSILERKKEKKEPPIDKFKKMFGIETEPIKVKLPNETLNELFSQYFSIEMLKTLKNSNSTSDEDDEYAKKLARDIALIKAASGGGSQEIETLKRELEYLRAELQKKEKEALVAEVTKRIEDLDKKYADMFQQIMASLQQNQQPQTAQEQKSPASQISELAKFIEDLSNALSTLGIKVVKPSEAPPQSLDVESIKGYLEKMGYEIRPTKLSKDEVQKMLKEQEERLKAELENMYRQQYDAEKMKQITNLISEFFRTVGSKLAEIPLEEKRLKLAREVQQVMQQGVSEGGAEVASGGATEGATESGASLQSY